jgi:hypothetical protein
MESAALRAWAERALVELQLLAAEYEQAGLIQR